MKKFLTKIFMVAVWAIFFVSCENEVIPVTESSFKWERLPYDKLSDVREWYKSEIEVPLESDGKTASKIMWGTAKYGKTADDGFVISAYVADDRNKQETKNIYLF